MRMNVMAENGDTKSSSNPQPKEDENQKYNDVREECIEELEAETNKDIVNIKRLVQLYEQKFPDKPILRLVQDINQRAGIYNNLLEDIKRGGMKAYGDTILDINGMALKTKERYEELGLVPVGSLPNPTARVLGPHR
jgi:hypothetical protein